MSAQDDFAFIVWKFGLRGQEEWRRYTGWRPENLRKPGLAPATLIDVGVAQGTPRLYAAFPDAHLVLVEPLREFEDYLRRITGERRGEYILAAAGAEPGRAQLFVDHRTPYSSSLLMDVRRPVEEQEALERRDVPVTTLDQLRGERGWQGPFGLKLDAEGYEHHVLEGAEALLRETQFVISEVSVARPLAGGISFAEFIARMDRLGFAVDDVLDGAKSGYGSVDYVDLFFRRV